jgi:hypothetical protein
MANGHNMATRMLKMRQVMPGIMILGDIGEGGGCCCGLGRKGARRGKNGGQWQRETIFADLKCDGIPCHVLLSAFFNFRLLSNQVLVVLR